MVNYCCIQSCNRNSRNHKHLKFYSLPRERNRQKLWLKRACRDDLLDSDMDKLRRTLRFCSRHFSPKSIVNRHLTHDALPTISLPGSTEENEPDLVPEKHEGVICDSCQDSILGFRYKCVTCDNFDLCQKCEMLETHPQHYMLRIPKSIKFCLADDLVNKWRNLFQREHIKPDSESSSDDEPVTKYISLNVSGIDLAQDVKNDIRNEITRAIKAANEKKQSQPLCQVKGKVNKEKTTSKRKDLQVDVKRIKVDVVEHLVDGIEDSVDDLEPVEGPDIQTPELVFADVNAGLDQADVKPTMADPSVVVVPNTSFMAAETQPLLYVTLSNDLSQFMIELTPDNHAESSTIK